MVKSIQVNFDDKQHAILLQAKGTQSWRDFIMTHQAVLNLEESKIEPKNAPERTMKDMEQEYDLR